MPKEITDRKLEHILICLEKNIESMHKKTGFQDVEFIHRALPELNFNELDISIEIFNHKFDAPILINAMTGGHEVSKIINENLARLADEFNIALVLGSQRAAIKDPKLEYTYNIARKTSPKAFIIGNLGAPQITKEFGMNEINKAIQMINANALTIHLNALQESLQDEGEPIYEGVLEALKKIKNQINIPLIIKETGAGIAREEVNLLKNSGVDAVDISGAGGTSWAAVEYHRTFKNGSFSPEIAKTYWDWGIPTAISTIEASMIDISLITSGGIRNGLDIAKAIALGADLVGMSLPFLKAAYENNYELLKKIMNKCIKELKIAMFLTKSKNITDLKKSNLIISGYLENWLKYRGISAASFSNRA
ncbi:MAG: type 2 isopentenyl-diphosphate Delta-isomerase [Candidatus Helarchaeota archaeon]